ncbi:6939_t:CDS:10 [Diversispora eburnea]|uniref:ER membrane protein complex subunit 1 n=1 Tax=Diversispora eburnea TaxID=1213867 RepID=A0A9N9A3B9_9GLOM|nr:6939_t:CDS:10 [Diversispora eburnea]
MISLKFLSLLILTFALQCQLSLGLYADQAGVNDWHQQYIGTPKFSSFHRTSRGATILAASERNVIASINPRNGNIEWRQIFEKDENILAFKGHGNTVISVTSIPQGDQLNGYTIRLWDIQTGFMIWEKKMDLIKSIDTSRIDIVFVNNSCVLILIGRNIIINLDSTNGREIWRSDMSDSSTTLNKLVGYEDNLYAIGLKKSSYSYNTIEVITFNIRSGFLKSTSLSSKINHIKDMMVLGGGTNTGFIIWIEKKVMRVNKLGTDVIEEASLETLYRSVVPSFADHTGELELIDLNLGSRTEFLAQVPTKNGYSAAVFKVDPIGGRLQEGVSVYSGTFDKKDRFILSRTRTLPQSSLEVLLKSNKEKVQVAYRMFAVSSDGSTHFFKESSVIWQREESLAHTKEVEFLDLPERKLWTQEVDELESETISPFIRYFRRLRTHFEQLKGLPDYLITYIQRFATGDYNKDPTPAKLSLHRDTFGFRKLLIFITRNKVIALDTINKGQVVWSRYFGDEVLEFQKIFVVRSSTVKFPPIVVAIGIQKNFTEDSKGSILTRLFRLDALTGNDFILTDDNNVSNFPPTFDISGKIREIFKLPLEESEERTHILALVDEDLKARLIIRLFSNRAIKAFVKFTPSFYFVLTDGVGSSFLKGYNIADTNEYPYKAEEMWAMEFSVDEKLAAIGQRPHHEKVASLGRVLVENTIVYHFWKDNQIEKGYEIVVYDLYESEQANERFDKFNLSSFSFDRPYVSAQSFMFPYGIRSIGVTTTKNGIAMREFLFALDTDQILGIPKRILDPRRPQRALTNEDKEEMLIPYESAIPDNKRFILSYHLPIVGIRKIVTSPALLESTSLVLAYGLDLWFTREAPSKTFDVLSEDFSKGTLLATILGLVIGILITKPMVRRKILKSRWY